jgi:protein-tyrosine phosphatase
MEESVRAAAEREVDISAHAARRLRADQITAADVIVCMAAEHRDAIVAAVAKADPKTFTLKEVVRLLESLPAPPEPAGPETLAARVAEASGLRVEGFEGNPYDDGIVDPLGLPLDSFRAVAWELDQWCGRLVEGLFGRVTAHASPRGEDE